MEILEQISTALQQGRMPQVTALVSEALEQNILPIDILQNGLMAGMSVVGARSKNNEIYVPQVLIAARAMNAGAELLKPYLGSEGTDKGTVVLGTIKGDLHDIGKNLVKMMMESKGLVVHDLGVDVDPQVFLDKAKEYGAKVICISALLTTTMETMRDVVIKCEEQGIRDQVKIMVGGAPVTQWFCDSIGADAYTEDAVSAAETAVRLCAQA